MSTRGRFACARWLACMLIFGVALTAANPSAAQNQKNKKSNQAPIVPPDQPLVGPPPPDTDAIDHDIGEMLAAFQLGDIEMMHKYYSDNVTFVSGDYAPAIKGWAAYLPLYQRQRAAFQGTQVIRRNTLVFVRGDFAWATYQWELDSTLNGQPYSAFGQTTLVLNKNGADWLIVHNHTSQVATAQAQTPTPPAAKP